MIGFLKPLWKIVFCVSILMQATSCGMQIQESNTKVTNGLVTSMEPAIVMLRGSQGRGFCTGSFVNDQTMITAAHCVYSGTRGYEYPYVQQPNGLLTQSINIFIANETRRRSNIIDSYNNKIDQLETNLFYTYNCDETSSGAQSLIQQMNKLGEQVRITFNGMQAYDLAVVVFPKGTGANFIGSNGSYLKPLQSAPNISQKMKLVGYGSYNKRLSIPQNKCYESAKGEGFGTKRYGFNEVKTTYPYLTADGAYSASFAAARGYARTVQSSVAQGDSGGPMIICADSVNCDGGFFGAVNSTSSFGKSGWGDFTGTPTYSSESLKLMQRAINCPAEKSPCAPNFL